MSLPRFQLHRPESLAEACALRARFGEEAALFAGGTELLLAMKLGIARWPHLIDLKRLPELRGIERRDDTVRIGAASTHRTIEVDAHTRNALPALSSLLGGIANVRVRVAGTLGGNLCFGEPHADPPALLVALGATVELAAREDARRLPLAEFLTGAYSVALGPEEILTTVEVPVPPPTVQVAYRNFRILERPTVGVAVVGRVVEGRFGAPPRVVVGAVDEVPRQVESGMLEGVGADDADALAALGKAASAAVDPVEDLAGSAEYKKHLAGVLARRTALAALAGAA